MGAVPQPDWLTRHELLISTKDFHGVQSLRLASISRQRFQSFNRLNGQACVDTKRSIMAAPSRAIIAAIWTARSVSVSLDHRLKVLNLLDARGPLTVRNLSDELQIDLQLATKVALNLAFECAIAIDLTKPLTFDTTLRTTEFTSRHADAFGRELSEPDLPLQSK